MLRDATMHGSADTYTCSSCDTVHEEPPFSYYSPAPAQWQALPVPERDARSLLTDETCEIDNQHFFVRGRIQIPVLDADRHFEWDVWVTLSRQSYERTLELWRQPGRESEPPYFGWLQTRLPYSPLTINLKTHVHTQPVGERPLIELEPTCHPLAVEQREGITLARVHAIAAMVLHDDMPGLSMSEAFQYHLANAFATLKQRIRFLHVRRRD